MNTKQNKKKQEKAAVCRTLCNHRSDRAETLFAADQTVENTERCIVECQTANTQRCFLPALRYAIDLSLREQRVCPSVCHTPVLCQNEES